MLTFKQYDVAAPAHPGAHLSHLEDLVFDGPASVSFVNDVLQEFGTVLDAGQALAARVRPDGAAMRSLNVSVKWDGSPAIVFGPDPADKQFFVATKSAFSKIPKLAKTHNDIDMMYADDRVRIVLHHALEVLAPLAPEHVLQGDMLFSKACPTDMRGAVREQQLDGGSFLTFQPNTILYAVEKDSELGKRIQNAKFGIVVHTAFTGTGQYLSTFKRKNISPMTYATMKPTADVVLLDASYDDVTGTATFTDEERGDFFLALADVKYSADAIQALCYDTIQQTTNLRRHLYAFVNNRVRNSDGSSYYNFDTTGFLTYLEGQQNQEEADRLTERGRASVRGRFGLLMANIARLSSQFDALFRLHQAVHRAKRIIIQKLNQAASIRTFLPTATGFRVSGPEGYVAISHAGQAVKLVDRLEFSRANFLHRDSGNNS